VVSVLVDTGGRTSQRLGARRHSDGFAARGARPRSVLQLNLERAVVRGRLECRHLDVSEEFRVSSSLSLCVSLASRSGSQRQSLRASERERETERERVRERARERKKRAWSGVLSLSLSLPLPLYGCIAARAGRAAACSVLTSASLCLPVFEEALRVCEFVRLDLIFVDDPWLRRLRIHGCGSGRSQIRN